MAVKTLHQVLLEQYHFICAFNASNEEILIALNTESIDFSKINIKRQLIEKNLLEFDKKKQEIAAYVNQDDDINGNEEIRELLVKIKTEAEKFNASILHIRKSLLEKKDDFTLKLAEFNSNKKKLKLYSQSVKILGIPSILNNRGL